MKNKKTAELEAAAYELSEKIIKAFKQFRIAVEISGWEFNKDRIRFKIKLKRNTRQSDIFSHITDVQSRLKLPLFHAYKDGFNIYIVASDKEVTYPRLLKILDDPAFAEALEEMELPYVVGFNILGDPIIVNLSKFPHLLLGGSSNSGKSIGLQAMITSIVADKLPAEVNIILIDVGAGDLIKFDGIPHLSCPVVRDCDTAYHVLTALAAEMERRKNLEIDSRDDFLKLPRIVLVIDEFPALFSGGLDKETSKTLVNAVSGLLQRGRHAKIHVVLAAQNPTFNNMKVDLGNITARIAFRCAKKNFSETILGEGGAENLFLPGSLLLKSPQNNGLQWIQGIYVKSKDIQKVTQYLKSPQYSCYSNPDNKFNLSILTNPSEGTTGGLSSFLQPGAVAPGPSEQELLLAAVIFWAFGKDYISTNMLMVEYHLGWNKAANLVKQMERLGIVSNLNGKQARTVRPKRIDALSDELVEFMECCDYPRDSLICAFQERSGTNTTDKNIPRCKIPGGVQDEQT